MSDSASRLNAATDRILAAVADVGAKVTAEAAEVQAAIDALRSNTDVEVGIARLDGVVTDLQAIGASVEAIVDPANPGGTAPASGGTTDPLTGDPIPPSDPFGP